MFDFYWNERKRILIYLVLLIFLFLDCVLFIIWIQAESADKAHKINPNLTSSYPEINQLRGKNLSFEEFETFFSNLAGEKGAKYSFQVLKIAQLPPNTDLHLLGHVVGDVLFKEEGANGIKVCTQDFRNACSHSIVVGLLSEKGEVALDEISDACEKAPGGKGAYTMCFHGLGHGILAYAGYDFKKSVEICKRTGTSKHSYQEVNQCISGSLMEMISGGFHDRQQWGKQRLVYLKKDRPLSICSDDLVPKSAKTLCFIYLTPFLLEAVEADKALPKPADFEKAFLICNQLPKSSQVDREACYGGFGKEFVVLANSRDVRDVEQMTDEQLGNVYGWCELARVKEGIVACVANATNSLYWGGENDRDGTVRFCNNIGDEYFQEMCIVNLIRNVGYYIDDLKYKKEFCGEINARYQDECRQELSI